MLKNFLDIAAAWNAATGRREGDAPSVQPNLRQLPRAQARARVN